MDFSLIDPYYLEVFNLIIAACLGLMMGYEREKRNIGAGLRTFALICLGSCLFTTVATVNMPVDSGARLLAQIITGIGFIGAGIIWRQDGGVIHGMTTAADIWVAAGIGIAVGMGFYFLAVASTIIVMLILRIHTRNDKCKPQTNGNSQA